MSTRKTLSLVPFMTLLAVGSSSVIGSFSGTALQAAPLSTSSAPVVVPTVKDNRKIIYKQGPDGRVIATVPAEVPDDPAFARFKKWMGSYLAAPVAERTALQDKGLKLAKKRTQAMVELIKRDPEHAIELALRPSERAALPAAIAAESEEWISGRGDFSVMIFDSVQPSTQPAGTAANQKNVTQVVMSGMSRTLTINGRSYTAYVYGRRENLSTKSNLLVHGVAVNGVIAIHESPLEVLAAGQTPPAGAKPSKSGTKCPICGKDAANGIIGLVGSTIYYFDTQEDVMKFTEQLWEAERVPGPNLHG